MLENDGVLLQVAAELSARRKPPTCRCHCPIGYIPGHPHHPHRLEPTPRIAPPETSLNTSIRSEGYNVTEAYHIKDSTEFVSKLYSM